MLQLETQIARWGKMMKTVAAVYEQGVLRLLTPLPIPEQTRVQVQIVGQLPGADEERQRVRHALVEAGVIRPRLPAEPDQPVSAAELVAAVEALAIAGPLSDLIIAERKGR